MKNSLKLSSVQQEDRDLAQFAFALRGGNERLVIIISSSCDQIACIFASQFQRAFDFLTYA
jgi:hypothetical protein